MTYKTFHQSLTTSNCQKCTLGQTRQNIVVDRGNYKSGIMVVGEAPGADEDEQGKPFVGRSGKMFDKLCLELGIHTNEQCWIVNIIKCRPPKNRPPTPSEIKTCFPYLKEQINLTKPHSALLLGRTAIQSLFPELKNKPMKTIVGQWLKHQEYPNIRFMPVFHPAYILRDPRKKGIMLDLLKSFFLSNGVKSRHDDIRNHNQV